MTANPKSSAPQPVAKQPKRARTRALLIDATARLVAEKGFERVSLEDVASAAGMTRGAVYGNFANKEDLLLAMVAEKWQPIMPPLDAGAGFAEQMAGLAEAIVGAMAARRAMGVAAASFQLYALTHPAMRERIETANSEIYRALAERVRASGDAEALPVAPETLVRVLHALVDGLMFLHALTPALIDAAVVRGAFSLIAASGAD